MGSRRHKSEKDKSIEMARTFFVQKPDDISQSYVQWAQANRDHPPILYNVPSLDAALIPPRPGWMTAVIARPGHNKSTFLMSRARAAAATAKEDEIVVVVSWEHQSEEIEAYVQSGSTLADYTATDLAWNRVPMDDIRASAVPRARLPLWVIAPSARHNGQRRPMMTLEIVHAAIESIVLDYGKKIILACFDYLQIIPSSRFRNDQTAAAGAAAQETKTLATNLGFPVYAAAQSGRQTDQRSPPIPMLGDVQHSSAIEQAVDAQIGLWVPIKTIDPNEQPLIAIAGKEYPVQFDLTIVRLLKQRFDAGYGTWPVRLDPKTLVMSECKHIATRLGESQSWT